MPSDPAVPPDATIVHAPLTDMGNAERFAAEHHLDLRFVYPWRQWIAWDGTRWAVDQSGAAVRRAKQCVRWLYTYASTLLDDNGERQTLVRHALKSESEPKLRAMMKLAESDEVFVLQASELDSNPWYLNVANGTINLKTGELRPHSRRDLITKIAPVAYSETAECPRFHAFLEEILPDPELQTFVQRAAGYSLTGTTGERCLFIPHGSGANGKTTLLEILHTMLGDYAQAADVSMLMARRHDGGPRPELVRLVGTRFVSTVEVEESRRLAESLVKQITGNDTIAARDLYAGAAAITEFAPTFKVWMATNHKPQIHGTDDAIWDRVRLIPFGVTIPPDRRNWDLPAELRDELPGILAWAVAGCLAWQAEGLTAPEAVRIATELYREEMDIVAAFLEDRCVVAPMGRVRAKELYTAYKGWAEDTGERPLNLKRFGERLKAHDIAKHRTKRGIEYTGIDLRPAA